MFDKHTVILLTALCSATICARGATPGAPPELIGHWAGRKDIVGPLRSVPHPDIGPPDTVTVRIAIHVDGRVEGLVGGASFAGVVERNRGPLLRMLGWASDFVIKGVMTGRVVPKDTPDRKKTRIVFDLVDGKISASLFTGTGGFDWNPIFRNLVLTRN